MIIRNQKGKGEVCLCFCLSSVNICVFPSSPRNILANNIAWELLMLIHFERYGHKSATLQLDFAVFASYQNLIY